MKTIIILALLLLVTSGELLSQTGARYVFAYDGSGNRVSRNTETFVIKRSYGEHKAERLDESVSIKLYPNPYLVSSELLAMRN